MYTFKIHVLFSYQFYVLFFRTMHLVRYAIASILMPVIGNELYLLSHTLTVANESIIQICSKAAPYFQRECMKQFVFLQKSGISKAHLVV